MALFGYRQWEWRLDLIDLLQWPAMVTTVLAAWLIGSLKPRRRMIGFVCFLLSNLLWVLWGWPREAWALVLLQFCLAGMNLRGLRKNEKLRAAPAGETAAAVSPESSGH